MATSTFTTPADSDTAADFRAWGSQISAQLQACGLHQTTDTGQINWSTVTLGSYSNTTSFGYEIYSFDPVNDPQQSTTPIFIKIEYGAGAAEQPQMWITVGMGSNGSGTINGTYFSNRLSTNTSSTTTSFGASWPSYICYNAVAGYLGMFLKINMGSSGPGTSNLMAFCIARSNDTNGNSTSASFTAFLQQGNVGPVSYWFANPTYPLQLPSGGSFGSATNWSSWPGLQTHSYANGSLQVMPVYGLNPGVFVNANMCIGVLAEIPISTTFSLNVVGLTNKTFLSVGSCMAALLTQNTNYTFCTLWQ